MVDARRLVAGAAWTYGAQVLTMVVQFAYAAVTARLLTPADFGAYAVALSVSALVVLVANGGLGQAVSRSDDLPPERSRALSSYGLLLGIGASALLLVTAEAWAALWRVPEAASLIRLLAVAAFAAPWISLGGGLLRRQGRFRTLASIVLTSNIVGMSIGVVGVWVWRSPSALLLSPLIAQVSLATAGFLLNRGALVARGVPSGAASEVAFSGRFILASIPAYVNGNIGKIAVSAFLGGSTLGQWNRADVVTTVPFIQVQNALVQAVYPEFRHQRNRPDAARTAWSDLLVMAAWIGLPAASVAAVLVPRLVPVLFGEGWEIAQSMAVALAVVGGLQLVTVVLSSGIEALGLFRWVWATQGLAFTVYFAGAFGVLITDEWWPIMVGLILAQLGQHLLQVVLASRRGYLDSRTLLRGYGGALLFSAGCAIITLTVVVLVVAIGGVLGPAVGFMVTVMLLVPLWLCRKRLPPVRVLRRYGLGR